MSSSKVLHLVCPSCGATYNCHTARLDQEEREQLKELSHIRCSRRECREENAKVPDGCVCVGIGASGWTGFRTATLDELLAIKRARNILKEALENNN